MSELTSPGFDIREDATGDAKTLVERLHIGLVAVATFVSGNSDAKECVDAALNAIDEVSALEAERDALKAEVVNQHMVIEHAGNFAKAEADQRDAAEDERDALREERKRFYATLNDLHDVPPEHDSEPVAFHKGWELAIRRARAALSGESGKEGTGPVRLMIGPRPHEMVAAFNANGEQVGEYQGPLADVLQRIIPGVTDVEIIG